MPVMIARPCGCCNPTVMLSLLLARTGLSSASSLHAVKAVHAEINNREKNVPFANWAAGLFLPPPLRNVYKMFSF